MISVNYRLPAQGLGTDFSDYERPLTFAAVYDNRFRNITGGAERRPGMDSSPGIVVGTPNLTRLHEHVDNKGNETLLSSDDFGNIYMQNASAATWSVAVTAKSHVRQISAQAEDKLIFVNGQDRNFYTDDGGQTFNELKAIITKGVMNSSTSANGFGDSDISNWLTATLAANNDIVFNTTLSAYGMVSTIVTAGLTITPISTSALGAGRASRTQAAGDTYELIDYVDLNIIPQGNNTNFDNIAIAGSGTTITTIAVSGVNFATTAIRSGDFVYNTTRGGIDIVGSVSANININNSIGGQTVGDSVAFFKSAMPIASWIHVHYGRVYYLDSRDQRNIVISAPDDPEDVTTYQKTLQTTSVSFGTQQPTGDIILTMGTFQQYFVAAGLKNIYIYSGNTPIADSSSTTIDFNPIAVYPDGVASRFGITFNGSDLLYISKNGLQAISIGNISNTTIQNNVSTPIRTNLIDAISHTATDDIQTSFYPRRSWIINKVGTENYVLNNSPTYDDSGQLVISPSWHRFIGKWAQMNHYFVRRNGDLYACGPQGLVCKMDSSASTDTGTVISTNLTTAWMRLEEPKKTKRVKQGQYIAPVFESGPNVDYTINVVAGWDTLSSDTITASAGGSGQIGSAVIGTDAIGAGQTVQAIKYPLRWRGEEFQLEFITETSAGPDVITGFNVMGTIAGIR